MPQPPRAQPAGASARGPVRGHADQVRGTCRAGGVGCPQDRWKDAEQPEADRVSGDHHDADGPPGPRLAVREGRVRDDGWSCGREHQAEREQQGDPRPRAGPAGREPGERSDRAEPAEWLIGIRRDRQAARRRQRQPGGQPEQDRARIARPDRDRRGPRSQPRGSETYSNQRREQAEREVHALGGAHLAGIVPHRDLVIASADGPDRRPMSGGISDQQPVGAFRSRSCGRGGPHRSSSCGGHSLRLLSVPPMTSGLRRPYEEHPRSDTGSALTRSRCAPSSADRAASGTA